MDDRLRQVTRGWALAQPAVAAFLTSVVRDFRERAFRHFERRAVREHESSAERADARADSAVSGLVDAARWFRPASDDLWTSCWFGRGRGTAARGEGNERSNEGETHRRILQGFAAFQNASSTFT